MRFKARGVTWQNYRGRLSRSRNWLFRHSFGLYLQHWPLYRSSPVKPHNTLRRLLCLIIPKGHLQPLGLYFPSSLEQRYWICAEVVENRQGLCVCPPILRQFQQYRNYRSRDNPSLQKSYRRKEKQQSGFNIHLQNSCCKGTKCLLSSGQTPGSPG